MGSFQYNLTQRVSVPEKLNKCLVNILVLVPMGFPQFPINRTLTVNK
jgi:hypothetical protein